MNLGTGTSFDIKTLAPDVDYTKLTANDFNVEQSGSVSTSASTQVKGGSGANSLAGNSGSASTSITKSYNASTCVLTAYGSVSLSWAATFRHPTEGWDTTKYGSGSNIVSVNAYLVVK